MIKVLYSFIIDTYKQDLNCTLCCRAQLDKRDNFSAIINILYYFIINLIETSEEDLSCTLCWEQLDKRDHFSAITQINTSSRLPLSHISFIQLSTLLLLKSSHIFPHEKLLANVFSNSTLLLNLVIFSLIPDEK